MILTFPKDAHAQLSTHFNTDEFSCHCECKTPTLVDVELIRKLDRMRELLGKPLKITSGYRCSRQQQKLRDDGRHTAISVSTHERGMAADLFCANVTGYELAQIAEQAGFTSIGTAKTWIHVDTRGDLRRWTY